MTTIFIKTCPKDHQWLQYLLPSIEKYAEGFKDVVIVSDAGKNVIPPEYLNTIITQVNDSRSKSDIENFRQKARENWSKGKYDPEKTLTLYINSYGGDLYQAFALIDMMRLSKHPIRTIGLGTICSAALLIFSSGTKGERLISKNTELMMHQYSNEVSGKHHELMSHIKGGDLTNNRMIKLFQDTSNLDAKAIKSKLLAPTDAWLTAEELKQYGIADKIF